MWYPRVVAVLSGVRAIKVHSDIGAGTGLGTGADTDIRVQEPGGRVLHVTLRSSDGSRWKFKNWKNHKSLEKLSSNQWLFVEINFAIINVNN